MFKAVKEQDEYKNTQTHYYLTKGDSCVITATPFKNGSNIAGDVSKCTFKLGDSSYKLEKEINMPKSTDGNSFVLTLDKSTSSTLTAGQYNYEIEYTMNDNISVYTPHAWKFDIIKEIQ
jgi:hypothetical protein